MKKQQGYYYFRIEEVDTWLLVRRDALYWFAYALRIAGFENFYAIPKEQTNE